LLSTIGLKNVTVVGDTRFDRVLQIKQAARQLPIVEAFVELRMEDGGLRIKADAAQNNAANDPQSQNKPQSSTPNAAQNETASNPQLTNNPQSSILNPQSKKVFIAGSSWEPDEEIFIKYFNLHRDWKLIIAPHVVSEDHLHSILSKVDRRTVRYTQTTPEEAAKADCLIIDCYGLLSSIYAYGQVAYIGGGFGVGIHNVLEAAVWREPVVFGPKNQKFHEAQGLLLAGGAFQIDSYKSFSQLMRRFEREPELLQRSADEAARFVENRAGATQRVLDEVKL